MYCRSCGALLSPTDRFCGVCGARTDVQQQQNVGQEKAESILSAAQAQLIQGASRGSDVLAISSVLEDAADSEEGGTTVIQNPDGFIPGVSDMQMENMSGFRDRSVSD